jgi:hypothetical protein
VDDAEHPTLVALHSSTGVSSVWSHGSFGSHEQVEPSADRQQDPDPPCGEQLPNVFVPEPSVARRHEQ